MKKRKKLGKIIIIVSIIVLAILFKDFIFDKNSLEEKNSANVKNEQNSMSDYTKKIFTPGALRVSKEFLNKNSEQYSEIKTETIIELTNKERVKNGNLPALVENIILDQSAKEKVEDMFNHQYFEHMSPDGKGVGDLALKNGYDYIIIGENLALGNFKSEEDLLSAWMNSQGHRANILNEKYSDVGVYAKKGTFKGTEVWIAVQHFGLSLSICPKIDNNLKTEIEAKENQADQLSNDLKILKQEIDENYMLIYIHGSKKQETVKKYNLMAEEYNNLIKEAEIMIFEYNKQIKALNDCIQNKLGSV